MEKNEQKEAVEIAAVKVELESLSPLRVMQLEIKVETLLKEIGEFKITGEDTRIKATDYLTRIKKAANYLDGERKKTVTPFNDEVSKINTDFKKMLQPLSDMEATIKKEMKRDYDEQLKAQREAEAKIKAEEEAALKKLQKDLKSKDETKKQAAEEKAEEIKEHSVTTLSSVADLPTRKISTGGGTVSMKKVWKWKVIDKKKVPLEYLEINEKLVNIVIKSGTRELPGFEIYEDTEVATRTK
jgi:hypothetical protein